MDAPKKKARRSEPYAIAGCGEFGQGKRMRYLALVALALLSGCQTADPYSGLNRCQTALKLLGESGLDDWQKRAVYETARNEGCLG